jgi:transposase
MSAHRSAPIERVEVITRGARRRWSMTEKRSIVAESLVADAVGAEICRRHDISSGQLSTWRRQCRASAWGKADAMAPVFVRAMVVPADPSPEAAVPSLHFQRSEGSPEPCATPPVSAPPAIPPAPRRRSWGRATPDAQIEIALPDGAVVRVGSAVDQAALSRVLAALRGQ